ncbi:MAG: hypothetical protein LBM67_00140 [Lentimicrobiaceae bacterium]|jgi:hypothetical protein|nr:hypothetical protein [Lentimicrobiaceae bacterium]
MIKSPLRYPGGKSRAVETIATDEFCLSGSRMCRELYRRSATCGYESQALWATAKARQTTDLKGHIFITVGERSVTYGKAKTTPHTTWLKAKTFITAGEHSVTCGVNTSIHSCLKGRTKIQTR